MPIGKGYKLASKISSTKKKKNKAVEAALSIVRRKRG